MTGGYRAETRSPPWLFSDLRQGLRFLFDEPTGVGVCLPLHTSFQSGRLLGSPAAGPPMKPHLYPLRHCLWEAKWTPTPTILPSPPPLLCDFFFSSHPGSERPEAGDSLSVCVCVTIRDVFRHSDTQKNNKKNVLLNSAWQAVGSGEAGGVGSGEVGGSSNPGQRGRRPCR